MNDIRAFLLRHRWKVIIISVIALWFLYNDFQQSGVANTTVYVTRTGAKYHRDGCNSLRKSKIPMTLEEASKQYAPCKLCDPPVISDK